MSDFKSDDDALQGYWLIVSYVVEGEESGESATHYHFDRGRFRRVAAHWVDDGTPPGTYQIDENAKRLVLVENRPDGAGGRQRTLRALYRIANDRLEICTTGSDQFPPEISPRHIMTTLERERGPAPRMRPPSGKKPLVDSLLGIFPWSDLHDQYQGTLPRAASRPSGVLGWLSGAFTRPRNVGLSLEENESGDIAPALDRAKALVFEFAGREAAARAYAASQLLPLKNESWLGDGDRPVTEGQFRARMVLDGIHVHGDRSVTWYFRDGDLFAGHWIVVSMDAASEFTDAEIAG